MQFWAKFLAKIVVSAMSIAEAANLRNRLFEMKDQHEIMWTALDDIARMYPDSDAGLYAKKVLNNLPTKYGR